MRSYTNIEQSKKLAEILPIESADMYYCYGMNIDTKIWSFDNTPTIIDADNQVDVDDIPCWSLAALLALLPKEINVLGTIYSIDIHTKNEEWFIDYKCNNEEFVGVYSNILVDACFEMIVKLHEQNIL